MTVSYVNDDFTDVAIIDPLSMLGIVNRPELEPVVAEARARLDRVAAALAA